jgi:TonB family protein
LLVLVALAVPARLTREPEPRPIEIVFRAPEREPEPPPPPPEPEPEPQPLEVAEAEPEPPAATPPVVREAPPVERRVEPAPPPVVARVEPPRPVRPAPRPRTGTFAEPAPAAPVRPERVVTSAAAFTARPEPASAVRPEPRAVADGRFGGATALPTVVQGPRTGPVVRAAFDDAPAPAAPAEAARDRGAVTATSFGDTVAAAPARRAAPATVREGGFGDGAAAAPAPSHERLRAAPRLDTPVEVVAKPKPAYTDEARERRIEGTVVLEVTFLASGRLRIHRVVEGLGHGLDEAALDAAGKIEFKPARRDGRPVDHTATLRVVFKLA